MKKNITFLRDTKRLVLFITVGLLSLSGCATDQLSRAPLTPFTSWTEPQPSSINYVRDFSVQDNFRVAEPYPVPNINESHAYQLSELIDMAQMNNPDTRIAWQQARQAALAVGMTEATFLPMISASVIGGYQKNRTKLPYDQHINTSYNALIPAVGFQWLLFDFGQRRALVDIAEKNSFAANVSFNGMHQKLIYDVTSAYFMYGAALSRVNIAQKSLQNSQNILDAAQARRRSGIATTVEVAQATQQVAQSRLNQVLSQGAERDAWQALLGAIGISPASHFTVSYSDKKALPDMYSMPTQSMIKRALSRRPDVLASFAAAQAANSGIKAAEADFLPKVYMAGAVVSGDGRFDVQGLPSLGSQSSSSNILVGVSVPLYDGGIRAARVKEAESRASASNEVFKKTQNSAVREIVAAASGLRSALESNKAALNLVSTATITYDAALDSYRNGVGTITVVNEANNNLLFAQQLSSDSYASARIAAANLAFVMGEF
ncbi:TPA: TolC family protein [Escherichia coli]|nr:TolC family protein [Escherichia coli]